MFRVTNNPSVTGIGNFPTAIEFKQTGAGTGGTEGNAAVIPNDVFTPDSRAGVMRFTETSYFVGNNAAGLPALFRVAGTAVEELVDGVEDVDILYGLDTSAPEPDGIADTYVRAQVVSVRISVLVVGPENNVATAAQTYTFRDDNGDGVADSQTAPDRRLRQVFTSTIALRNRVL
jgi:type IV pilus assembly protein PilW